MKKPLTLLTCLFFFLYSVNCQLSAYWQQQVNFKIDVTLDDKEHSLDGFERVQYINNSPDTLRFIWFHLWPNAYKNDKTAFSEEFLQNGRTDFYFSNREERGYINRLDFRINESPVKTEDHPNYIDVLKIILPAPLPPGGSVEISTPFHVKLPKNFSRGGHTGQSYQVTQWYPKPAVYDKNGWQVMPYLDQGEFYSEFGNYEVKITVPENYAVAATGELQNETEKIWLLNRSTYKEETIISKLKTTTSQQKITINKAKPSNTKKISNNKPATINKPAALNQPLKTLLYKQNNIHDFAWFADKRYAVKHDTIQLNSGKIIEAYAFYNSKNAVFWKNAIQFIKKSVRSRSQWVGDYPYNVITVVEAKMGFEGGMEYPTITSISPVTQEGELEGLIEHETGHNWFYGALGSNERLHPWMDEGMNSYYDSRYDKEINRAMDAEENNARLLATAEDTRTDQPIETSGENFAVNNYNIIAYYKANKWMQLLEKEIGRAVFDQAMQEYYKRWQFKHPAPGDFKQVMEEVSGKDLSALFSLLQKKGPLPQTPAPKTTLTLLPFDVKGLTNLIRNNNKAILVSPIIGANTYDQLMIGAGITNYLPPSGNFRFLLAPMYSTNAKTLSGLGRLSYRWFPKRTFAQGEIFLSASKFTTRVLRDDYSDKNFFGFTKLAPGFRLTFKENNSKSTARKYIQWKTYLFKEDNYNFTTDTVITPGVPDEDTAVLSRIIKGNESRYLNQLKFVIENNRALYPYNAELQIDQGKDFIRAAFTGNYFFNYSTKGGANLRFFAGKFFYIGNKVQNYFATYPYHLNMTGAKGEDDYTYSQYFIGRNEQLYWRGQQISIRDGGFKVRTDLLGDKVGRTDDWLVAANFTTTIPDNLNILSVLPVKIPLKIFIDAGTYAAAWKKDAEGTRFLYDAGFQVSLFRNTLNIYVPVLYSKVYSDYFKSYKPDTKFWRNISFSIDLQNIRLPNIVHNSFF